MPAFQRKNERSQRSKLLTSMQPHEWVRFQSKFFSDLLAITDRNTIGQEISTTCVKCYWKKKLSITILENLFSTEHFEKLKKKTINFVVNKLSLNKLATYLQQAGRLAGYGQ